MFRKSNNWHSTWIRKNFPYYISRGMRHNSHVFIFFFFFFNLSCCRLLFLYKIQSIELDIMVMLYFECLEWVTIRVTIRFFVFVQIGWYMVCVIFMLTANVNQTKPKNRVLIRCLTHVSMSFNNLLQLRTEIWN